MRHQGGNVNDDDDDVSWKTRKGHPTISCFSKEDKRVQSLYVMGYTNNGSNPCLL